MTLTPLDSFLAGAFAFQTLGAVVGSLPQPKQEGWYSFVFKFLKAETNILDELWGRRYGALPPCEPQTSPSPAAKQA